MNMKNVHPCMSRGKDDWSTPWGLFSRLDGEFRFVCDAAADAGNALCEHYLTDALTQEWGDPSFVNPPYSMNGEFIRRAYMQSRGGKTIVCLVPSRTDTRWWHDFAMKADEIRFLKGRLKFSGSKDSAPFPSAILIFRGTGHAPVVTSMEARS